MVDRRPNSVAPTPFSNSQKASMGDVPATVEEFELSGGDRESIFVREFTQMSASTQGESTPKRVGQLEVKWERIQLFPRAANHVCPPSIRISHIALSVPAMYKGKLKTGVKGSFQSS
jgi:hypothetical protein